MRQAVDTMAGLSLQDDQIDTPAPPKMTEASEQTDIAPTDAAGTSSTLPPVHFMPPRQRGMTSSVMLIS